MLFLKADIDEGWHIYSAYQPEGGPVKTTINFTSGEDFTLLGKIAEPKPVTKYEKAFEMDVKYFTKAVIFQQKIKLKDKTVVIKGELEYMVCNDQKCLPPETINFSIPVK